MSLTPFILSLFFTSVIANAADNSRYPLEEKLICDKPTILKSTIEDEAALTETENEIFRGAMNKHGLTDLNIKEYDESLYITSEFVKDLPLSILEKMSKANKIELEKDRRNYSTLKLPELFDYHQRLLNECRLFDAEIERKTSMGKKL